MRRLLVLSMMLFLVVTSPAKAGFEEYEITSASASLSSYQAGAHADLTTAFEVRSEFLGGEIAQTRDVKIDLPPGLIGNPNVVPKCTVPELGTNTGDSHCPVASQVGVSALKLENRTGTIVEPVYNMPSPGGDVVARFGFLATFVPVVINVRVRPEDEYGVTASVEGAPAVVGLKAATTTIWGVPADPVHDPERVTPEEAENGAKPPGGKRSSGILPAPFLSNPTRCGVPLHVDFAAASYQAPSRFSTKTASLGVITGCGKVDFQPSFSAVSTSREAAAPTGLDVEVRIPQDETVNGRATSSLKDAAVVFPEGMTLAAGAADGLQSCTAAQAGYLSRSAGACPPASKLGSVEFDVPALERSIQGGIYQRTPEPGHLFRVWIVVDELGAHIALPGEVHLDPVTGRVTSMFLDTPQVPVREIHLHLFGGPRGPLANPSSCGTYYTNWEFAPWSGKPPASGNAPMTIDNGCGKGGFGPKLTAGTTDPRAGAYSPFTLDLTRDSWEENISRLKVSMPPGLLAKLGGIPLCAGDAAKTGNCSPASRIGSVSVAAGPGSNPLWIPQPGKAPTAIFLGGPYAGAPYSLVISVPAQAGPFDLGTVITRSAIHVDPETARVSIESDPLPQILEGVPISYRVIHAQVDRPSFTLNATNCKTFQVEALTASPQGATATARSPYQATNCAKLVYRPKLSLALRGGTRRTGHPALRAVLKQSRGQANNASATVILPSSQFIDQNHINNPCTRVQFNAGACPRSSILGRARAVTPLLDKPLEGPIYFRSNGGQRELPDVVADLQGSIHVVVVGFVDSVRKKGSETSRIRTRFANLPDAPVAKVTMSLFGGKRGLLVNSRNICQAPQRARLRFQGQNGRELLQSLRIKTSCKKHQ